jgi:hypothetical protein
LVSDRHTDCQFFWEFEVFSQLAGSFRRLGSTIRCICSIGSVVQAPEGKMRISKASEQADAQSPAMTPRFQIANNGCGVCDPGRWAALPTAVLLTFLLLAGCCRESVQSSRSLVDATGTNQLVLNERVTSWLLRDREDKEFHSLVWRVKSGTNWMERAAISRADFQLGSPGNRWVSDIDSLDSSNGTAIIKVVEASLPISDGSGTIINYVYSWRQWNLPTNGEVCTLRFCKDRFEKYYSN